MLQRPKSSEGGCGMVCAVDMGCSQLDHLQFRLWDDAVIRPKTWTSETWAQLCDSREKGAMDQVRCTSGPLVGNQHRHRTHWTHLWNKSTESLRTSRMKALSFNSIHALGLGPGLCQGTLPIEIMFASVPGACAVQLSSVV